MRKTSLISFAVLFVMVGGTISNGDWCDVEIVPEHPTSCDVVVITLSGGWGDSCIPNASAISRAGNDIYFDVIWDYPPDIICAYVITPWELTESVGPLPCGTYTIYARVVGYPGPPGYEPVAEFTVTDKQFVLSTESLTVPEGGTETFTVALLLEPAGTVEVSVTHQSGDPDITVESGETLFFDPCNYSVPQTVTLAAAEDDDYLNGAALIQVTAPEYLTAEVTATEGDNDIPSVLYVDADATGNNNGRSWVDAFTNLQDALSIAEAYPEVEEIHIAQGTYKPAEPSGNRNVTFQLFQYLAIRGGYAGFGEPDPDTRNIETYETILSGDLNGNDGPNFTNRGDNSYLVLKGRNGSVLDGFTITGGDGGVQGGGIHSGSSDTTIINCTVINNRAGYGGGLYSYNGSPTLTNCLFIGNQAKPNTIGDGGGVYSSDDGRVCGPTLINCTFVGNSANDTGGGLCSYCSETTVTNCIFWGNSDGGGTDESAQIHSSSTTVHYSCVQGWTGSLGGTGNIGQDPLFADPNNGDYHLKSEGWRWDAQRKVWTWDEVTSGCIDAGNPGSPLADEPLTLDVDPLNRWGENIRINMGAYGGTAEASMPPYDWALLSDMTNDGTVNSSDLGVFVSYWLDSGQCIPSDLNRNQFVNFLDYAVFAQQWSDTLASEAGIEYEITPCDMGSSAAEQSGETRFTVTVQGRYILFEDMMVANCCATELWLEMDITNNLITIHEHEYGEYFCLCICDYPVTATLGPFEPGTYTLEVYEDFGGFIGSTIVTIE